MKKVFWILPCISILLVLASCGRGQTAGDLGGTSLPQTQETAGAANSSPDTLPPDTAPEDTTPPDTTPEETVPPDTIPEETTPPDTTPPDTAPEDTQPVDTAAPADGIRPEFKKAMDEYEAFYREYVDFMKKYQGSDDPLSMLTDYFSMLERLANAEKALSDMREGEMSTEELKYYTEVTLRIAEMLEEVE